MFIHNRSYTIMRVTLVAAIIAGIFNVRPARAETTDFGWAQRIGGKNLDYSTGIAVDESGYVYTSGFWIDSDSGDYDAQIYKWNPTGTYLWLHGAGGLSDEIAYATTLDGEGNVYAAGAYSGTVNLGEPNNTYTLTSAGLTDIFILKYKNEEILSVRWAKGLGGISSDSGYGMTVDSRGNVYVTGTYMDTVDFDPSEGVSNLTSAGDADAFVLKLDGDGNFLWAKSIGGPGSENSFDVVVDESGNVFTTGYFHDTADFDPGSGTSNLTSLGARDIFISKLDSSGNFVWVRRAGGGSFDAGVEITLDGRGNAYMAGYSYDAVSAGNNDILIGKLDQDGNFVWTKSMGGTGFDASYGIALDESGNIYTTGEFTDTVDFDPGEGISSLASAGASDIFISKLDNNGNYVWAKSVGGISNDVGEGLVVQNDSLFLTGAFSDTVDFDPGAATRNLTSVVGLDVFVAKWNVIPQIHYVKWDATGANDGTSWQNAYTDLQSALSAAANGDEIWVAAGTYKPTSTTDRMISFVLKNGVAIYGGFAGTETSREQRDYGNNVTILSGDIGVEGDNSDNSYHVVVGSNTNNSAILDGFTITAGNADDTASSQNYFGGGVYINKGSPRLNEMIFIDNHAGFGGGIYASHTEGGDTTIDLILTNVVFKDNTASGEGGGIATLFYPDLSSASFSLSLTDVIFENNTAVRTGGGMINNGGELELMNVTFNSNTAAGGGGLSHIPYEPSTLTNVTFSNNSANDGGGGMLVGSSGPAVTTLTNVTFNNNSTAMNGGGIANAGYSELIITNATFRDNTAGVNGGGISNGEILGVESGGTVSLINTTFSNNTATSNGGAIVNESGNINIYNSILYGDSGGEIADTSGAAVVTYSIVQGGYIGVGNLDEDPFLGPLQDNGGLTQTMALSAGSPAIDAAEDADCPSTDQRGVTRPQRSHCDVGAYEYDGLDSTLDVIIGTSEVDSYVVAPHESQRRSYVGINRGPVKIVNTNEDSITAAERVIYKVGGVQTSFTELMGLPDGQLDNVYWLPWYNNIGLDTQLRIANATDNPAAVTVTIGGEEMPSFDLEAGESTRVSYPVNDGPVQIVSTQKIVAAERVIYTVQGVQTSFSEMMALPASQLDDTYWFPWYNNTGLDTQLRIANATNIPATVTVTIGGVEMPSFELAGGESTRVSYPVNDGPVQIVSDQDIVAAERVIYTVNDKQTSFSEIMGLPESQLDNTYWLPWYNNTGLDTQLRIGNVSDSTATVHIFVGGDEVTSVEGITLLEGESTRLSYPLNDGPVQIVSDQDIVAAARVIYKVNNLQTSFSEMMALPNSQLDDTYWFPWYNNVGLDTQLRFGIP